MTNFVTEGAPDRVIELAEQEKLLCLALEKLNAERPLKRVLILPPDFTRAHSGAGELTEMAWRWLEKRAQVVIMPALGTHVPMTPDELKKMFGAIPLNRFQIHDWRKSLIKLGEVPGNFIHKVSEGKLDYTINVEVNKIIVEGKWDLVLSVGQIVPHEVIGMANQNKNIFVGIGGADIINKSHFLGAVYNMERIMGREKSPVRDVFNYAEDRYCQEFPIVYALTVKSKNQAGKLVTRGLYVGRGDQSYLQAAKLSQQINLNLLDQSLKKVVVFLDPSEFKSTWLGNKAVYRTRMVIADRGELIVLAPGLREFGEDKEIDRLIRKYGYRGTPATLQAVKDNKDLAANLSAAAHLIHGSSEDRFKITYCPGLGVSRKEIESVNFDWASLDDMTKKYDPKKLKDGFNTVDGEELFYISNPALGLWALKKQFK
ncbi:MAG: lactate racemase domain-containing protein [Planctomycetota bacterium]